MRTNIWIINHYAGNTLFDKGGRHYWFAKFLKQKGYNPIVICSNAKHNSNCETFFSDRESAHFQFAEDIGVPYVFIKSRPYFGNGRSRILNMIDFYRNVLKTSNLLSEKFGRPDVVYASSVHPLTLIAGLKIAKKYCIKCICEIRDLWPESLIAYNIVPESSIVVKGLRFIEKKAYIKADGIIFLMEGAYDYIREQGWEKNVPAEKVYFINNGVDFSAFQSNKEIYTIDDKDLLDNENYKVVYTGSIRTVNHLGLLLDVAKVTQDTNIRFLIWGKGDELPILQKRVTEENINNVIFKGAIKKEYVPFITSCADLNIVHGSSSPILRFGISANKIFEYLAAGRPILVDFHSSYNPVIDCGAGFESISSSAEDIAKAVIEASQMNSTEKCRYSKAAIDTAKKYDFKKLTDQLVNVIESV